MILEVNAIAIGAVALNFLLWFVIYRLNRQLKQAEDTLTMFQKADAITLEKRGRSARYVQNKR